MSRSYLSALLIMALFAVPGCRTEAAGDAAARSPEATAERAAAEPGAIEPVAPSPAESVSPAAEVAAEAEPDLEESADADPADDNAGDDVATASGSPPDAAPPSTPADAEAEAETESDPEDEILEQVETAYAEIRSMQADFVQQLSIPLLGSNQKSRGQVYQRRPDRFLMRFTQPAGDIVVADGEYFWMYYPSSDSTQVIRTRIEEGGGQVDLQQEFLADASERYVATLVGEESVGGRPAHVLTLVPRGASPYRLVKVWVDKEDHLVRRFEITEENDSVRRIELSNLRINPELPDSLFEFTPPPGTQVFEQ